MFDNIPKEYRIMLYLIILISCLFIIPIFFWLGYFSGYIHAKKSIMNQVKIERPLQTKDIDGNELTIKM